MTVLNLDSFDFLEDSEKNKYLEFTECSIDKVKLLLKIDIKDRDLFVQTNINNPNIKEYKSFNLSACRDNWLISYQDNLKVNNFYIGYSPNWYKNPRDAMQYMVIEYNPNKINPQSVLNNFQLLLKKSRSIKFMYIDFAYDMNIDLQQFIVYPRHGNEYTAYLGHGVKWETYYFGVFGECGAVRIYNKCKEQKLKKLLDWTRYEIRIKDINFADSSTILDKLRFNDMYLKSDSFGECSAIEYIVLKGIQEDISLLSTLDKRTRKKYKTLLQQSLYSVKLKKQSAIDVFNYYCLSYINC